MFGLLMMQSITALNPANPDTLREDAICYSVGRLLGHGVVSTIFDLFNTGCLFVAGEHLTKNIRKGLRAMLRQEMGFFDFEANSAALLTSFLAGEGDADQGPHGEQLDVVAQPWS